MASPRFTRGGEVSSVELNQLADMIRSNTLTSIIGGSFSRTPGGTALFIDQQVRGGGTGTEATCPFKVIDASIQSALKVQVANTPVTTTTGIRWPDGMSLDGPPFLLDISQNCYIYCKLQYQSNDVILDTNTDAITVLQSNDILPNEVDAEYVLLATIETSGSPPNKINKITNVCLPVTPNPCNLAWA